MLKVYAQQQEWRRGVRIYSVSADGIAVVKLKLVVETSLKVRWGESWPEVVLSPVVKSAKLEIVDFHMDHLSKIGGEAAKLLGKGIKQISDEVVQRKNEDLAGKLNKKLEKHQDKLTFAPADLLKSSFPAIQKKGAAASEKFQSPELNNP